MKNSTLILPVVALAVGLSLTACSKSEKAVPAGPPPSGPVELKLKWSVGSRLVQSLEVQQTVDTFIPGMPAPMKQEMAIGQEYGLSVLRERSDGGREVEMEFLRTRITGKAGNQPLDFDSSKPASGADPVSSTLHQLVGAKILFFLDASNEVWKVEGLDEMQKRLAGGPKDPLGLLNNLLNEDSFKQMMDHARALPHKPVEPGDSWPVKTEVRMGELGVMEMQHTYTLKSWEKRNEHNCARIEFEGTVRSKPGQALKISGMNMSIEDGRNSGETWFDLEGGRFVDSTITQDMRMNLITPNQTITNVLHQLIRTKLVPK